MLCVDPDVKLAISQIDNGWKAAVVDKGVVLYRECGERLIPALTILERMNQTTLSPRECVFADSVLGLAAFRLAALMGARMMWGNITSALAVSEGDRRGIKVLYRKLVPCIMNKTGEDLCPMEKKAFQASNDVEFYMHVRKVYSHEV